MNTPRSRLSSSYAKIWEETKFQLPEYPQSGWKAMSRRRRKKKRKVNENNGQLRIYGSCPDHMVQVFVLIWSFLTLTFALLLLSTLIAWLNLHLQVLVLNKCDVCAKCNACKACLRCHTGAKHESEIFDTDGKTVNILTGREKEEEQKSVLTMVSIYAWTKNGYILVIQYLDEKFWSRRLPWKRSWPLFHGLFLLSLFFLHLLLFTHFRDT